MLGAFQVPFLAMPRGASLGSVQWVNNVQQLQHNILKFAGYPMARNLRAKIPEGDTMTVFDVNSSSSKKLVEEVAPAALTVAAGPREVAEAAVCPLIYYSPTR
jgi:hypothetical protein